MSIKRGLFRIWVFLSEVWTICIVAYGIESGRGALKSAPFQYIYEMKAYAGPQDATSECCLTPSKTGKPPEFQPIGREYVSQWAKSLDGKTHISVSFPDGSNLYLNKNKLITDAEVDYLTQEFWAQRWSRWWALAWPWPLAAIGPPLVLLILGRGVVWVASGFRS